MIRKNFLPLLLLLASPALVAIPADVEKLILEEKYAEALARVEVLLKDKPQDPELLKTKAELIKEVPASAASAKTETEKGTSQPVYPEGFSPKENAPKPPGKTANPSPAPTAALKGEDKLTLATLEEIMTDVESARDDVAKRQKLLREFLQQSTNFVERHPDYANIWVKRAQAALELDEAEAGWNAGKELRRLKIIEGDDKEALKVIVNLKRKGWLADELTAAKAVGEEKKRQEMLERLTPEERKLVGVWDITPKSIYLSPGMWRGFQLQKSVGKFEFFVGNDGILKAKGDFAIQWYGDTPDTSVNTTHSISANFGEQTISWLKDLDSKKIINLSCKGIYTSANALDSDNFNWGGKHEVINSDQVFILRSDGNFELKDLSNMWGSVIMEKRQTSSESQMPTPSVKTF